MKVLVTGNMGYIGSVLVETLLEKSFDVVGYDTNFYNDCSLFQSGSMIKQIFKDTRDIEKEDLDDIDSIIHLAALSNDPLGELNPKLTHDINYLATVKLAKIAKAVGIKRFIYSSSQSMYGISSTENELDEDSSEKNPITEYAKTKWDAELEINKLASDNFIVTSFRPSTVFGLSPKLRVDIVFNNLVACAYTTGKIEIKSDGTPWRPVVHVKDVANAFIAGLEAPSELIQKQAFNVGIKDGNYTVRDLAEAAQRCVPGSRIVYTNEYGNDSRTYRVSFDKILSVLKDYFTPEWNLDSGGEELVNFFRTIEFTEGIFRSRKFTRLRQIEHLLINNMINQELRWK